MIINCNIIDKQFKLLQHTIASLVDADYVYLDVPSYLNVGDWLIAMGAFNLLKEIPYKCLYYASSVNYQKQYIPQNAIILLHGGGNFGDLYYGATEFRNEVIKDFPNNKIIILPQTITYTDESLIAKEASLYARHKNLFICARDKASFAILQKYFSSNNLFLLPDTAIGLYPILPKRKVASGNGILEIRRVDKELLEKSFERDNCKEVYVADWNTILNDIKINRVLLLWRCLKRLSRAFGGFWCRIQDYYLVHVMYRYVFRRIPQYVLQYKEVHTTRLHGFILCMLMHVSQEWVDTKYGKISGYINTWINYE